MDNEEIVKYLRELAGFQFDVVDKGLLIQQLNQMQVSLHMVADHIKALNDKPADNVVTNCGQVH